MALQTKYLSANGSNGHHKFTLTVNEDNTNTTNNTSTVSWLFQIDAIEPKWNWSYTNAVNYTININGSTYTGTIDYYDGSSTVALKSGSLTAQHNADGSKSISYSFSVTSLDINYLTGSASASGSMVLTKIPRAATIQTAPNFTDEQNPTITYSNPAGNAVSSLQACITDANGGGYVGYRDISKTGTSYTFNLTDAERTALRKATPNSNTFTVKFYVRTKIGETYYYSSLTKTMTITNAKPTVTFSAVDAAGFGDVTGDKTKIAIKGISNLKYTITATGNKHATIKSYSVTNGSVTKSSASDTFWGVTTPKISYTVTDSRGNTTTGSYSFTMVNYVKLTCSLDVEPPTTAGAMNFTISGNYFNGNIGATANTLTVWYRYKTNSGSYGSWTALTATKTGNTYKATKNISGLNYLNSYTVEACAEDEIYKDTNSYGAVYSEAIKVKTTPVFDWGEEDFNFNVPVSIEGNPLIDFVVEQGVSDRWTYRKWKSGIAECWGSSDTVTAEVTGTWGGVSSAENVIPTYSFPFTFAAVPKVQTTFERVGAYNYWIYTGSNPATASKTPSYGICRGTAGTVQVKLNYYVIGKWK